MGDIWDNEMVDEHIEQATLSLLFSSSDEEEPTGKHGGSRPGRAPNITRGRIEAAVRFYNDYFCAAPVYTSQHFMRRYRIALPVFKRVIEALEVHNPFFTQRKDCTGQLGFTSLQKATTALRLLAYGSSADSVDEYVRMGESTALLCLEHFCEGVIACFRDVYMRAPTAEDLQKLLNRSAERGFPGMIGSIDCSKWFWKNCPTAYHGQYQGKEGVPAVTVEAIADDRLWIWHCFFGMPGCANDINVLDASPSLNKVAEGTYPPPIEYTVAGTKRNIPYWLADGVYPRYPFFFQTLSEPVMKREKLFSALQEARRKDAERAFGVSQGRWHILQQPSLPRTLPSPREALGEGPISFIVGRGFLAFGYCATISLLYLLTTQPRQSPSSHYFEVLNRFAIVAIRRSVSEKHYFVVTLQSLVPLFLCSNRLCCKTELLVRCILFQLLLFGPLAPHWPLLRRRHANGVLLISRCDVSSDRCSITVV